ncbi:MAG: RNA methyltransferase [Magnetospirillum sp.]|jgi:TrmH RNA methyltransferase|nr:RNA methyltransferase [Magnetospirillum sp.]
MKRFPPRNPNRTGGPRKPGGYKQGDRRPSAHKQGAHGQEPERQHRREILRIAGLPSVAALFARAPEAVQRLLVTPGMAQAASDLLREATARNIAHRIVPDEALAKIAGTPLNGGIVAETAPRPARQFDLGQAQEWAKRWQPLVILDGIGNPHNLGAIARTAAFFGLPHLAISDHPAQAAPSEAAYRVSEGGLVWLDVYRVHRLPDVLRRLSAFYTVVGTALGTGAPMPMQKLATGPKPVCLVLGNEEEGLSAATLAVCAHVATLPPAGPIQSLNVAATAAILIHAITGGFRTR